MSKGRTGPHSSYSMHSLSQALAQEERRQFITWEDARHIVGAQRIRCLFLPSRTNLTPQFFFPQHVQAGSLPSRVRL